MRFKILKFLFLYFDRFKKYIWMIKLIYLVSYLKNYHGYSNKNIRWAQVNDVDGTNTTFLSVPLLSEDEEHLQDIEYHNKSCHDWCHYFIKKWTVPFRHVCCCLCFCLCCCCLCCCCGMLVFLLSALLMVCCCFCFCC